MDVGEFLQAIQRRREYRDQIVHLRKLPERHARFGTLSKPLPAALEDSLAREGITQLYEHQAQSIEIARSGGSFIVVTGTASGKTLCYNLPVIESLMENPDQRAMYLFPTKALAQDQLGQLEHWAGSSDLIERVIRPATYDGDTPSASRSRIRKHAGIILTNPDMLHQGILPYHTKWAEFLSHMRYLIIDEAHVYRGIFGSHVANVIRRLQRVLDFHGAACQIICCSATIGNPRELACELTGRDLQLVDTDGSPRGTKYFMFWNPPYTDAAKMIRRSANVEGKTLFCELIKQGVPTIAFTKARVVAELMYRYAIDELRHSDDPTLAERVKPYRGGFLAKQRRQIEKELFSGKLLGVTATTALELGIDVGSLDAAVLVGFPGTISSAWQQAGRAGRRSSESLAVLVGYNDPIDQYFMTHPDYFFSRTVEQAVIDPANPYILESHLACAAFELPLSTFDRDYFGEDFSTIVPKLTDEAHKLNKIADRWYFASSEFPSRNVSLRTVGESTYAIVDTSGGDNNVIGQVDSISAPEQLYPGAVYLHEGRSFIVRQLDLATRVASITPAEVDYYTQPVLNSRAEVIDQIDNQTTPAGELGFGNLEVAWQTVAFKKVKFYTMELVGQEKLDLPELSLATQGLWFEPDAAILRQLATTEEYSPIRAMSGLRNLMIWALPLLSMCDPQDIGGQVNLSNFAHPTIVLYDRYLGGLGFARRGFGEFRRLLELADQLVRRCECDNGCPSCVGLPLLRPPLHQDPDMQSDARDLPDKHATLNLLAALRQSM